MRPGFPSDSFADHRRMEYLTQVVDRIRTNKERFLRQYECARRGIEALTRHVSFLVQAREQALKSHLQQIGRRKIASWNKQLQICEDALEWLRNLDEDQLRTMGDLQATCNDAFLKCLDLVDAGEIKFEQGNLGVLKSLANLGRIQEVGSPGAPVPRGGVSPRVTMKGMAQEAGGFRRPWGVSCDVMGRILVADRSNNRIQVFSEFGKFLLEFGREGSGPGEFSQPTGVAVDRKCRIVVSDKGNHRVQVFTYSGGFLFAFGRQGSGPGQFMHPWDVATDSRCRIAVSDSKNYRVQLFNEHGKFLSKFELPELTSVNEPRGLAFGPDGSLLVTDLKNHCFLIIDREFKTMTKFDGPGRNPGEFLKLQGIPLYNSGRFAVADSNNYRIQVFDERGNPWKSFGKRGKREEGEFKRLQGISSYCSGCLVVGDRGNVQVF